MDDLMHDAHVFETSVKLQTVAEALDRYASKGKIPERGTDVLKWTASLIEQIDLRNDINVGAGLAEQAASVRTCFYAALANNSKELRKTGINDFKQVQAFLDNLYQFLSATGTANRKLKPVEAELAASVLRALSKTMLVQLTRNGSPINAGSSSRQSKTSQLAPAR